MVYSSYNIIEIHCHFTASLSFLRKSDLHANVCTIYQTVHVADTRPDLSKVGNRVECNISLTSQVCCYGASDWSK